MTRLFLDELRAEIDALYPDNTSGAISPADVRKVARDTVDSCVADDATIWRDPVAGSADVNALTTPTDIAGVGDSQSVDDNMDSTSADPVQGKFISGTVAGRGYHGILQVGVELSVNSEFRLGFTVDGVLSEFQSVATGLGSGKPLTVGVLALFDNQAAGADVQCVCWTPDGAETVTFVGFICQYVILPTNNP